MRIELLPDGRRDDGCGTIRGAVTGERTPALRAMPDGLPSQSEPLRFRFRHVPLLGRRVDLVHFESLGLGAIYPLAGELLGIRVVVSCRGGDLHLLEQKSSDTQKPQVDLRWRARWP